MTTFYNILHPEFTFQSSTFVTINGEEVPKRKGEVINYCRKIRIPLIQRDYAEGRPNPEVKRKISNFLKQLFDVVYGDKKSSSLDFIYGYVQDEGGKKCDSNKWDEVRNINYAFEPLDGQQRLTTLFLLYWILGRDNDLIDDRDGKSLFIYATRESSTDFCNTLVTKQAYDIIPKWKQYIEEQKVANEEAKKKREKEEDKYQAQLKYPFKKLPCFSEYIKDQEWFKWNWRTDPTICSMLNVFDIIINMIDNDTRGDYNQACKNNANLENIHFSLLDKLECNGQRLFVKMNARGKELSEFDLAKSALEEEIEKQAILGLPSLKDKTEWTGRIDGAWLDYCWHKITDQWHDENWNNPDITKVERYLLRLVKRMIGYHFFVKRTFLLEMERKDELNDVTKSCIQNFVDSIYERSNYCNNIIRSYEDYVDEMRKLNADNYVTIQFEDIIRGIDSLCFKDNQNTWHDVDELTSFTILDTYISDDNVDYQQRLLFNALIGFTSSIAKASVLAAQANKLKDLNDWLRFIQHMFRNENRSQRIDTQELFEVTVNELNTFINDWKQSGLSFNDFVAQDIKGRFTLEPERYTEEQIKAKLKLGQLANSSVLGKDWEDYFEYLEVHDTKFMLGQYYAPLKWSENNGMYDLDLFKDYTSRLHEIFEDGTEDIHVKFILSMLSYRDYLFASQADGFKSLLNFNAADRDFSWKRFLRDDNHWMVKEWLVNWRNSKSPLNTYMNETIRNAVKIISSTDWRYFLLRMSTPAICELIKRNYSPYYNIRLFNGHPYIVHTKTSKGEKQYDIILAYLVDRLKSRKDIIKSVDYNSYVRSDYTEMSIETLKGEKVNIKNYHTNIYYVSIDGNDVARDFNVGFMVLLIERIVNN